MIARKNTLVTVVTNPQSGFPLALRLIVTAPIQRGVATTSAARLLASGGTGGYAYGMQPGSLLPAGLTLDPVTGVIAGTPTTIGRTAFVAYVQDSSSTVTLMRFTLDVVSRLTAVANAPLPGEIGVAYSYTFRVIGFTGTVSWTRPSGTLPPGLTLSGTTGVLSGTPSVPAGISTYVVRATDSGTGDTLDISVSQTIAAALAIVANVPDALVNQPYAGSFTSTGGYTPPGTLPVRFSATGLPAGLTLGRNGLFGGMPTTPSLPGVPSVVVVSAFDSVGGTATATVNITVVQAPPALLPGQVLTGALNGSGALVATNASGPFVAILATIAPLPANTYANGAAGVGATLTMSATGVLTVDISAVALNDLVLVNNEVAKFTNGLYICTTAGAVGVAAVLTRSVYMDSAEKYPASLVSVFTNGGTNRNSLWQCWPDVFPMTVGSTQLNFYRIPVGIGTISEYMRGDGSRATFNLIYQDFNIGTVAGTAGVAWQTNGTLQHLLLTSATPCTFTFFAPSTACEVFLRVQAPAIGTIPAITWPASVKWPGGVQPAAVSTLGRSNMYRFVFDGANYWGDAIVNAA